MEKPEKTKEIRDPVHGDIEFFESELEIINTPEFQRMRGIRQLGLGYLVYPGAHHTRFEHSLGVAHMVNKIAYSLRKNCGNDAISDEEIRFVRLLALIHDIGHIPFGHTLEDERPIYKEGHEGAIRLSLLLKNTNIEKALKTIEPKTGKKLPEDLIRIMVYTHTSESNVVISDREKFLANIVGNTICADLLDYLKRDPYFTGIHHTYDEKFISAFEIKGSQIFLNLQDGNRLRHGVASEILHLLRLRYTLGERVYYHLTKASASAMISKAVEMSELPHEALVDLRDDELLYILENAQTIRKIHNWPIRKTKEVAILIKKIRHRQLYVPVYTISRVAANNERCLDSLVEHFYSANNIEFRAEVEKKIANLAGLKPYQVIIYCPDKKMSTKEAMVEVLWPKEQGPKPLQTLCEKGQGIEDENMRNEINQLKEKHKALWQLNVFVDPECTPEQHQDVAAYCRALEEFRYIENQNSNYSETSEETIFDRTLRRAIETLPEKDNLDIKATRELAKSGFHKTSRLLSIKDMQKIILNNGKQEGQKILDFDPGSREY